MAGYWPKSNSQVNDTNGKPMVGAKLYFYEGNTTTPLTVYTGADLSPPHTQPILADANGMWPPVFFAEVDGAFYREKATKPTGELLYDILNVPIIWQPPAEPPAPTIDETGICATGDIVGRWATAVRPGWLPCNGRTMGSASSGANYASADNEALFIVLWNNDPNLTVSSGRGVSAASDWANGKSITLPDMRGRVPMGDDYMGAATSAGRVSGATLGGSGGFANHTLVSDEMPAHTHPGSTSSDGDHTHSGGGTVIATGSGGAGPGNIVTIGNTGTAGSHSHTVTTDSVGGGSAHNNLQPYSVLYWFIKK